MTKTMKRLMLPVVVVVAMGAPPLMSPAVAACSDVPAPDVYWRRCVFDQQDLTELDVSGANLRDSSFKRADLSGSIMADVDAQRAKFITSTMQDVILDEANLARADFTKADLSGASLKGANLTWARMYRADLSGADLTGARLDDTDLLEAVLDGATWTDGKTVCAENSTGRCRRSRAASTPEPEAEVSGSEPPA